MFKAVLKNMEYIKGLIQAIRDLKNNCGSIRKVTCSILKLANSYEPFASLHLLAGPSDLTKDAGTANRAITCNIMEA